MEACNRVDWCATGGSGGSAASRSTSRSAINGATAISQSGATGLTLSISAARGGPSRRPQLRPELIVASAAILLSSPAR